MSLEAVIYEPGAGETLELRGTKVRVLCTAADSVGASTFEFLAMPGFDTGSHYHSKIEEQFYVIDGEMELRVGDRLINGRPGSFVTVPTGLAHAFATAATVRHGCWWSPRHLATRATSPNSLRSSPTPARPTPTQSPRSAPDTTRPKSRPCRPDPPRTTPRDARARTTLGRPTAHRGPLTRTAASEPDALALEGPEPISTPSLHRTLASPRAEGRARSGRSHPPSP